MKRLVRSSSGRQIYGPKWQSTNEGSDEIESDEGHHSASVESTEIAQVSVTQPAGNTTPVLTSGVVAAAPNVVVQPPISGQPKGPDNENQTWKGYVGTCIFLTQIARVSDTEAGNTTPVLISGVVAAALQPPISGQPKGPDNENQTWKGYRFTRSRSDCQSMYRAALVGDWLAAEVLLDRDPTLAFDEITERGDRALHVAAGALHVAAGALHVAAAIKRTEFVQKLVQRMSPSDLVLLDGRGYTACCYAAMSGIVEIADVMMKKNPNLITARDNKSRTPLRKAAKYGDKKMISYFLKSARNEYFSREEWFDLLLITVRRKMYDAALEILEKNGSLATMPNEEGTALHLLARQNLSDDSTSKKSILLEILIGIDTTWNDITGKMRSSHRLLAEKLLAEIQRQLDQANVIELMKNPPILHDAAKVGNVELITMLTRTYPDLIWQTDCNGHTIFHIAVMYRQDVVFRLIHQLGSMKTLIAKSRDKNGNNILHLAGKLAPPNRRNIVFQSAFQMHRELQWFKKVEAIVPPSCLEMKNKKGLRPRQLFSEKHKSLLEKSETWMRNTADSCMLIATIMLSVVFAAAFTAPGGNNGETGIPILLKNKWFTCFVIFEALALFGSTLCILMFWSIMTSSFEEDKFLRVLPYKLKVGLTGLFSSLVGAISAFMSAYFLVFVEERGRLVKGFVIWIHFSLVLAICFQFTELWLNTSLLLYLSRILSRLNKNRLFSTDNVS